MRRHLISAANAARISEPGIGVLRAPATDATLADTHDPRDVCVTLFVAATIAELR